MSVIIDCYILCYIANMSNRLFYDVLAIILSNSSLLLQNENVSQNSTNIMHYVRHYALRADHRYVTFHAKRIN